MPWGLRVIARSLAILCATLLTLSGCGLDAPEAPSFQTDVYIPLGDLRYTVAELIRSEEIITGDTTGTNPVYVEYRGAIASVQAAEHLQVEVPRKRLSARLGDLNLNVATTPSVRYPLSDMAPFEIPPSGLHLILPPFDLRTLIRDYDPFPEFREGTFRSGRCELTVHNGLPFAVEGLVFQLKDVPSGAVIAVTQALTLTPGGSAAASIDLSGKTISNALRVTLVSGNTPGSPDAIFIHGTDAIQVDAKLRDLRLQDLTAPVAAGSFEVRGASLLGGDLRILDGVIASAAIPLRIENTVPLSVTVSVTIPEILEGDVPWSRTYEVAAGDPSAPGVTQVDITLSDAHIRFDDTTVPQRIQYIIRAVHRGSNGQTIRLTSSMGASIEVDSARLALAEFTGIIGSQEFRIPETRTAFHAPAETEGVEFLRGTLAITIANGIRLPGHLNLLAVGVRDGRTARVSLEGDVAPATASDPATTVLTIDQTHGGLLDLVNLRPEEIRISGSVTVGDSTQTVVIRGIDGISGAYEARSPIRVRIHESSYRPAAFDFEIDEDLQERIREDLLEAEADLTVRNQTPIGMSVRLQFAADSANVYAHPAVVLDDVHVPAGEVDTLSGNVTEATVARVRVVLRPEDVSFFARRRVYCGALIVPDPTGNEGVALQTSDEVGIAGLVRFTLQVN